ncbi:CIC11C00000002491 [Sungouiella intermedia]|uniref:CIC11C00000002491 n=1 Tax=Sungouiella intermedia TaxID=45354 RepID=A0A1L0DPD7_9ASCO|nr:CIC11C00000002491 [[Candida] intermedia]
MVSRSGKRLLLMAVLALLVVVLLLVEQRQQKETQHNDLLTHIHDLMAKPDQSSDESAKQQNPAQKVPSPVEKEHKEPALDPCTAFSPHKGFIDLGGLSNVANEGKAVAWSTRGFDSGHNYSIGVCLSPIKKLQDVRIRDDLNSSQVGAFYIDPESGEYVLMGEYSVAPEIRGNKLTLTYANGSYCEKVKYSNGERLRRKTILTFTCDREMLTKAHVSYVAAVDDCTYLFEIRSHFACPTAAKADNLAVIWIFLLICMAALLVYFSGGFLYRHLKR